MIITIITDRGKENRIIESNPHPSTTTTAQMDWTGPKIKNIVVGYIVCMVMKKVRANGLLLYLRRRLELQSLKFILRRRRRRLL